eukprot:s1489_g12.t1
MLGTQVVRTLICPSLGLHIDVTRSAPALLYISAQASYCTSLACESSELADMQAVMSRQVRCLQALRRSATSWAAHNLKPRNGEILESFLPASAAKPACITWNLQYEDVLKGNALYPLESLWVHQGKLRCRLVAYIQGSCFHLRLSPSCEAGHTVEEMELQAMLMLRFQRLHWAMN